MRQFYQKYDDFLKLFSETGKRSMAFGRFTLCTSAKGSILALPFV